MSTGLRLECQVWFIHFINIKGPRIIQYHVAGSGGRKRDNHVVEYTSDRVTELTSESFSEKDAKLPPSKKVKNEKDQASNISLASSFDNTSNPTGTAESQNILQPQIDYIQLLQKNQEVRK